ncbi:MAG: PH domain-containing protein [Candidatus Saccharibacteria bacterium]|nr:PH domain-containing protein [Candidatus Saccharibacteria bacterium]
MNKKYCINCGQHIPGKSKFCPECGAPQHGSEAGAFKAKAPAVALQAAAVAIEDSSTSRSPKKSTKADNYIPKRQLCPRAVLSFYMSYVAKTAIVFGLLAIGLVVEPIYAGLGLAVYLIVLYITAQIVFNSFYYSVDETGFKKTHGVVHKHQVTIPYQQIQNVNISRGLADRILGLSRISIETAGNAAGAKSSVGGTITASEGYLPGISLEDAKELHDVLLENARESQ